MTVREAYGLARRRGQAGEDNMAPTRRRLILQAAAVGGLAALAPDAVAAPAEPRIDAARLRADLEGLSVFGRPAGGTFADGVSRVAYSDADVAGRAYVMGLLREAGQTVLDGADAVVPVPLHPWKRLQRGFNQSADLARGLGLPVRPLLFRSRATRAQAGLTPRQRRRNVAGAFVLHPWFSRAGRGAPKDVSGRILVLVDDVMTTGATLDACARVLKRAGAREVRTLTLARALAPASR